jgi:hypothetical protein
MMVGEKGQSDAVMMGGRGRYSVSACRCACPDYGFGSGLGSGSVLECDYGFESGPDSAVVHASESSLKKIEM